MTARLRAPLLVFLLSCACNVFAVGQGFTTAPVLPVAGDPQLLATADFNRDGRPDLAYLDAVSGGNLHLLLGNGDGSFRAGQVLAIPSGVGGQIDVADMNGDGIPDLVLNGSGVTVLLGRGDGTFGAPVTTGSSIGNFAAGHLAIADFDGDGKLDVYSASNYVNAIMKGDGKGGFSGNIYLSGSPLGGPDAFAADLNGDGLPDLLAANGSFGFNVALNTGSGGFGPLVSYTTPQMTTGTRYLALADVNGDGHLDVVFPGLYDNPGQLIASLGRADGTFATAAPFTPTGLHNFRVVGSADLHGDGKARVFLAGTEGFGTILGNSPAGSPMFEGSGMRQEQTVLADFNGDGIMDMATPDDHSMVLLFGKANGTFASAQAQQIGSTIGNIQVADANGDHVPDLIASLNLVFAGLGDGTFANTPLNPPSGYGTTTLNEGNVFPFYPANFNGDGKLDLLALPEAFVLGNGDGTFTQAKAPRVMGTPFYFGAVADFDGDGLDDGVELSPTSLAPPLGGVNIFMSKAQSFYQFQLPDSEAAGPVVTGDFDADGCQDLAVTGSTHLVLYKGDCQGNLNYTASYSLPSTAPTTIPQFATNTAGDITKADVDGDGHLDLILTLPALNQIQVFYGKGDGTFTPGNPTSLSRAVDFVSAADLDGDGHADVVLSGVGDPIVLYGSADRSFGPERVLAAGFQTGKVALADLRGIGKTDLVLPNLNTNSLDLSATQGYTYARFLNSAPTPGTSVVTASLTLPSGPIAYGSTQGATVSVNAANSSAVPSGFVSFALDGAAFGSAALDASGQAHLPLGAVEAGSHTIAVTYLGDVAFRTAATSGSLNVMPVATALSLMASPAPSTTLQPVTLQAVVNAGKVLPSGVVQFADGDTALGSAPLDNSGTATLPMSALTAGAHTFTATFAATQDFLGSQSKAAQQVSAVGSSTSITITPGSPALGASALLSITVGGGTAMTQPTGQVACVDGSLSLGAATLVNGVGTLTTTALPAGSSNVSCTYAGDAVFTPSNSNRVGVTVTNRYPSTVTLSLLASGSPVTSVAAGTPVTLQAQVIASGVPVSQGQVVFCDNSAAACTDLHQLGLTQLSGAGTATLSLTPGPGVHSYTARFLGTASALLAQSSAAAMLNVTGGVLSTASLLATGADGKYTLTAQFTGSNTSPTGSVTFLDTTHQNATLGTALLTPGSGLDTFSFGRLATPALISGVRSADFNGDGHPDLAIATGPNGGIVILLGKGDGSFATGQTLQSTSAGTANTQTSALVLGDFNGDGHVDIAALNDYDKTLAVFLGVGDGTFNLTPKRNTATSAFGIFSMAVADVNGDGFADIVGADESNGAAVVLLGNGDGTFHNVSGPTLPASPRLVIAGDFNEDGVPDLVFTTGGQGTLSVLLGLGDGTFRQAATPATGSVPISVVAADLNGDGHLDLAVTDDNTNSVSILLGKGDGTFQTLSTTYATGNVPIEITAGDFNGDGKVDLAVANELGNFLTLLLGNGDGTFLPSTAPAGSQPESLAAVDLNGDGRSDLVVGNVGENDATLLIAQGSSLAIATLGNITPTGTAPHEVQASYGGDATYGPRLTNTVPLIEQLIVTSLSLTVTPTQTTFGDTVTLAATLTSAIPGVDDSDGEVVTFLNDNLALGTCTLKAGACSLTTSTLDVGRYEVSASYAGDQVLSASASALHSLIVGTATPTITLVVPNHTFGDAPFSVIATSIGSGSFTFSIVSGPATVSGSDITLTGAGTVVLRVDQSASGNYAPSTQIVSFTVAPANQTIHLTSPATAMYGDSPVNVTAQASSGLPVALSVISGPAMLKGNALSFTGAGAVVLAADQAGNTNYNAAVQVRQTIQVSPASISLTWPATAALTYGNSLQSVLTATATAGSVPLAGTFSYSLGGAPVNATTVLNAGSYTLQVQFTPTDSTRYTTATGMATLSVSKAVSSIGLSTPAATVFTGTSVLLTASVSSAGTIPSGSVSFMSGSTVLGVSALMSGVAQLSVASLPVGTQTLSAIFSGSDNYVGGTSGVVSETVQDFSISTPSETPIVTVSGSTASTSFTLNATGQTLPGAVSFSASGLPPGATAAFSPASLPAGSTATSVMVTFTLPTATARGVGHGVPSGLVLAMLLLIPVSGFRSRRRLVRLSHQRYLWLLGTVGLAVLLLGTTGCGGGPNNTTSASPSPTPQDYAVTLTATSGTLQHSTTITLHVN